MYVIHGKSPYPLLVVVNDSRELTQSQAPLAPSVCIESLRKILESLSVHYRHRQGIYRQYRFCQQYPNSWLVSKPSETFI